MLNDKCMERFIRLSRQKIKDIFYDCNEKYFNNKIEVPSKFETYTPDENVVGWVRYSWDKKNGKFITHLHISNRINWTLENLRNTILHEMIHLELKSYLKQIPWWKKWFVKQHDKKFINRMNELNDKYNLNIVVEAKHLKNYIKNEDFH